MNESFTIVFAGGGSGGHVTPGIAVAETLARACPSCRSIFFCADHDAETSLIALAGFEYRTIRAAKFPRGLSHRLLIFPLLFPLSVIKAWLLLAEYTPSIVFSKGGYTSVPVCVAAWMRGIPILLHCSDSVPSLSDWLIGTVARTVCTGFPPDAFPETLQKRAVQTGNPVRLMIAEGSKAAGLRITGFSGRKPVLLIIGGSQGSKTLNETLDAHFQSFIEVADIIHLTGEGKGIARTHARYVALSRVTEELPHLYALADLVVTRAGAGVLSELAAGRKAAIVVPLPGVAHDHQVSNARALEAKGAVVVLSQDRMKNLFFTVNEMLADAGRRESLGQALHDALPTDAASRIAKIILDAIGTAR